MKSYAFLSDAANKYEFMCFSTFFLEYDANTVSIYMICNRIRLTKYMNYACVCLTLLCIFNINAYKFKPGDATHHMNLCGVLQHDTNKHTKSHDA